MHLIIEVKIYATNTEILVTKNKKEMDKAI